MAFYQTPPELGNQFDDDRVLRSYLARISPRDAAPRVEAELREMGELSGGRLYRMQLDDRENEPALRQWDAWGHRVDHIELTPLWREARRIACEKGVVATAYERATGAFSRVHQFALAYLFEPSTDVYSCPLAMTDGAARTLLAHGHAALVDRAVTRLTSRDLQAFWTSGQWMTERTGGSDVGISETVARADSDGRYRLYGTKWFTSATTSEMALTLARPEGNPPGGRGLALFYVERSDSAGGPNGIFVNRLKDKLGTRKVPTAELTLDGALATPVAGTSDGIRAIAPMLNVTRTWNSVCAVSAMRRMLALARAYARKRSAFGVPLFDQPLHLDTLAGLAAEFEAAFHLAFKLVEIIGREEAGEATPRDEALLRLLTPITKLTTARQAVAVTTEGCEAFGGAGYVEDTGIPRIVRDAQVLPIWEGTTNVLSLDALRVAAKGGSLDALEEEVAACARETRDGALAEAAREARDGVAHAKQWLARAAEHDRATAESGARRFALTLGRSLELALLARHAQWSLDHEHDARARAAAVRFSRAGVDSIEDAPYTLDHALARDEPVA